MTTLPQGPANVNPSRFVASSMDPKSFIGHRHKEPIPLLRFSLKDPIEPKDALLEPKEIKLALRSWVKSELDRQITGTDLSCDTALACCVFHALERFMCFDSRYHLFASLSSAFRSTSQVYDVSTQEDFAEMEALRADFKVSIPEISGYTNPKRRTYRFPQEDFKLTGLVSGAIGVSLHTFIELMAIDGLRCQPGIVYKDHMDAIIDDFYYQFLRRLRKFYAMAKHVWTVKLCNEVEKVIADIEEWGV